MSKVPSILLDRPIAFNRAYVSLGVGVTGALMLSQAVFWQARSSSGDGWFYKTVKEWTEETGLTRTEQENARARLEKLGILAIERRGIPARLFFSVDLDRLVEILANLTPPEIKSAGLPQSGSQVPSNQDGGNSADMAPSNPQSKQRKTTKETTTETTTESFTAEGQALAAPAVAMVLVAANGMKYHIPAELRYPKPAARTHKTWSAYAIAYMQRYSVWPVWNATVAGQVSKFIERVGEDFAPRIAVHFVRRVNEEFVVRQMHPVKLLLADAEKWSTQAQTGQTMTATQARAADQTEGNANAADEAAEKAIAMVEERRAAARQGGGPAC